MAEAKSRSKNSECVKVAIRCRPLNKKEKENGNTNIVSMDSSRGAVSVRDPTGTEPPRDFTFDNVFGPDTTQKQIYDDTAFNIVESVLEGYNGTIFAYGQTGTGKTFTMVGADGELVGMIPRAFEHIFNSINSSPDRQFMVSASYLEIYNEQIRDLLGKDHKAKLDLRDHPDRGTYVKDLSHYTVKNARELQKLMDRGVDNRSVAATNMNAESSRSHSLFTIVVESQQMGPDGKPHVRAGKLNMVDLAGSERQSKTGATGEQLKEATNINKSLSALGAVINALVENNSKHIPYRDSKLTHLLKDSLGGNTKTVMVANLGPAEYNYDETLTTLRYANRAKNIKNKPKINEDPKDTMIREFQEQIAELQKQLAAGGGAGAAMMAGAAGGAPMSEEARKELEEKMEAELKEKFERERKKVQQDKEKTEAEKEQILAELKKKEEEADKQKRAEQKLLKKLQEMEAKVIQGSDAEKKAMEAERDLIRAKEKLDAKRKKEAILKAEQERIEKERAELERACSSKEDVIQTLMAKVHKLENKVAELQEQQDLLEDDRRDLFERQKTLSLKDLIIEHFIPIDKQEEFNERVYWDDEAQMWRIYHITLSGNSLRAKKPRSCFAGAVHPTTMAACEQLQTVPMYRQTGLCQMDLDLPEASAYAEIEALYGDQLPPAVKHAIDSVLAPTTLQLPDTQPQVYYAYNEDGSLMKVSDDKFVGSLAGARVPPSGKAPREGASGRPMSAGRHGHR